MRGIYLDGVVLDEFADMDPRAWFEVIRPTLADRKGWATFIGTPKGHNAFYEVWRSASNSDDRFTSALKASETGLLLQSELTDAAATLSPDQYAQEFECSFEAAIQGAFYSVELNRMEMGHRIARIPLDNTQLVHTAWDLGFTDSTAI